MTWWSKRLNPFKNSVDERRQTSTKILSQLGNFQGFDSLNDVEFTTKIAEYIPIEKSVRLCVSDDGKKALSVRQIVERLIKLCDATRGGKKDAKGQ